MMMNKKKPFSLHLDVDSFMPATAEEKEVISRMRPSSTFFRDGVKRLLKNKVATISLILIVLITLSSIIIPMFWPYSYERLKIQASSIPTKKQNQQTFFSFEGDCIQPLAGFCNSFSPKRKGILPELLHCVNTFSVIPVICEMWFVSSYFAPCVDALRKNSLPVRNSSSVMSHNPTPYCLNHPRWKGLNPRRCPVPFQKLFHIGGG